MYSLSQEPGRRRRYRGRTSSRSLDRRSTRSTRQIERLPYLPVGVVSKKLNGAFMTESNIYEAQFVNPFLARLDKRTESCKYLELLNEHSTQINNPADAPNTIDIKLKNPYPSR